MRFYEDIAFRKMRKCTGLYLWFGAEQELYATLTITSLKKERVVIESVCSANSLEEIIRKIPPNLPLIISVDGINVIHRIVSQSSSENPFSQAFPGVKVKDFFARRHVAAGDKIIFSLVRREEINKLIKSLNEAGILIYDLTLGPFVINNLPGIITGTGEVQIPFYDLYFQQNRITDFRRILHNSIENTSLFEFGDEQLSSEFLVSLSMCYGFYQTGGKGEVDQQLAEQRKELAAKVILSVTVMPFILLFFIALLINFLLLMDYGKDNSRLNQSVIAGKQYLTQIDSLRKAVMIGQQVFETKQNRQAGYIAFFSDRIASCVLSGILLTEMNIYPRVSTSQKKDNYKFRDDIITVNGITDNSVSLEAFVKRLSCLEWIESVKILNFAESKDGVLSFQIEITIGEE